ncbi:MAG: hypothetical protein M1831_006168 [Alyxoria varia]|nr:MAG: hypothetical protein M1831_006168 [Alyxoria varia]
MFIALFAAATLLAATAHCQSDPDPNTILSCADVDCGNSTTDSTCDVGRGPSAQQLGSIGLRSFKTPASPNNITLTVAYTSDTQIEKNYFIGTPPDLDLQESKFPACSVFFTQTNKEIDPPATGTCQTLLPNGCAADLEEQGMQILRDPGNRTEWDSRSLCQALVDEFNDNLVDSCKGASGSGKWQGVDAEPLTGPRAPEPIGSRGTCHPTLPKSNDLSLLYSFNQTGVALQENEYRVVPVLTVMGAEGDQNPYSHLECLAAVPDRGNGGTQSGDAVVGVQRYGGWVTGMLAFVAAVVLLV